MKLVEDEELKDAAFLLLANKQDLKVLSPEEVSSAMDFNNINVQKKKCMGVVGTTGHGIEQAMEWIAKNI